MGGEDGESEVEADAGEAGYRRTAKLGDPMRPGRAEVAIGASIVSKEREGSRRAGG